MIGASNVTNAILKIAACLFFSIAAVAVARADALVYDSTADAVASGACDPSVTQFTTLGRSVPNDGGGATWVYKTSTALTAITCTNGRVYELSTPVANVRIFGALGNGTGDDGPEIQLAFDYSKAKGVPVYAPAGIYRITSVINISHAATFYGDGRLTKIVAYDMTGPLFNFDIASATSNTINFAEFKDFSMSAGYSSGSVPSTGSAFSVSGPANSYL